MFGTSKSLLRRCLGVQTPPELNKCLDIKGICMSLPTSIMYLIASVTIDPSPRRNEMMHRSLEYAPLHARDCPTAQLFLLFFDGVLDGQPKKQNAFGGLFATKCGVYIRIKQHHGLMCHSWYDQWKIPKDIPFDIQCMVWLYVRNLVLSGLGKCR